MKFAICNEIFEGWPLNRIGRFVAETGYDALEIAPFTLGKPIKAISEAERSSIRLEVEREGVRICGLHWVLAHTEGMHLTHPDPTVRNRTAAYLSDLVILCRDFGGEIIVFGSPKQRNLQEGVSMEEGWHHAVETFAPALRQAEESGITICFEPLAPTETNFINTAGEARRFAVATGSSAMKIILDVKAMSSEDRPIPEVIRASAGGFAHFHANDPNLKGPGFGRVDFTPIFRALRETGFKGHVSVEVFNFEEGPEAIARQSLDYMRRCLVDSAS